MPPNADILAVDATPRNNPEDSVPFPAQRKGDYIPDYRRGEKLTLLIVACFIICIGAIIWMFQTKVSRPKVIFADRAKLVGVAKAEEVRGNIEAFQRVAADYVGYIFNRSPQGIIRQDMLPYICTDESRQQILNKASDYLKKTDMVQVTYVRQIHPPSKIFQTGMEIQVDVVIHQYPLGAGRQASPVNELSATVWMTLEFSRRVGESQMYPFLVKDISIEETDS